MDFVDTVVFVAYYSPPQRIAVDRGGRLGEMREVTIRVPTAFFDGGTVKDVFHGTSAKAARDICEKGFRIPQGATTEYGQGVYFFEGDYVAALWFADKRCLEGGRKEEAAVIQAEVELGRCLFANVLGEQISQLQKTFAEWYGENYEPEDVFRFVCEELLNGGEIDSVRFVRLANKRWKEPGRYRAEIVLLVYDAKRIKKVVLHKPAFLKRGRELTFDEA